MGETKEDNVASQYYTYLLSPIREDKEQGRGSMSAKLRERYIVYIPLRSSCAHFSCLLVKIFPVLLLSSDLFHVYVCACDMAFQS